MKTANTGDEVLSKNQNVPLGANEDARAIASRSGENTTIDTPRHFKEAEILVRAIDGDLHAANNVLGYLNSTHADLRRIMQETLHDARDPRLWRILLSCLAADAWVDYHRLSSEHVLEQRSVLGQESTAITLRQSIAEAFAMDESEAEKMIKNDVLLDALKVQYTPLCRIRYAAAWMLGLRGDVGVAPILEEIIDELDNLNDISWPSRAVDALAAINDELCGPPLIKALAKDRGELHQQARRALSDMGHLAEATWIVALRHEDSHVRWHAARALGQLGDPRGVEVLAEGLYDENHAVRWATARVLANLDAAAIPAILKALIEHSLEEQYRQVVYHALHAMPSHQTQEYLKPLLEALHGPSPAVESPAVAQRLLSEWKPKMI